MKNIFGLILLALFLQGCETTNTSGGNINITGETSRIAAVSINFVKNKNCKYIKSTKHTHAGWSTYNADIVKNRIKIANEVVSLNATHFVVTGEFKDGMLPDLREKVSSTADIYDCKQKEKIQIAEKEEPKKIEPEKKSLDNDPPIIDIKDIFIVKNSNFEIDGKVSDTGSKLVYVKVADQDIPVNNGKFKIKKYSPVDTEIKITAIDEWGNQASKLVKIKVKLEENIVKKLEPLNPLVVKSKTNDNKLALIIGIENYSELGKATYANNDASYFKDYAKNALGIKNENIQLLLDEDATFIKINKVLKKWLKSKVISNKTEIIVFYAGHGLAAQDGDKQDLYLLPHNADTDLLSISSISRNTLFKEISNLEPKSVTIFFDACYSGTSRDNKTLIASARPINILKKVEDNIPKNFTIFSASQLNQMSSGLKNGEHGIFSYYLMKGLEGLADQNKDKKITNGELQEYMNLNVPQRAAEWGREQNPSLSGDPDKVLIRYR